MNVRCKIQWINNALTTVPCTQQQQQIIIIFISRKRALDVIIRSIFHQTCISFLRVQKDNEKKTRIELYVHIVQRVAQFFAIISITCWRLLSIKFTSVSFHSIGLAICCYSLLDSFHFFIYSTHISFFYGNCFSLHSFDSISFSKQNARVNSNEAKIRIVIRSISSNELLLAH